MRLVFSVVLLATVLHTSTRVLAQQDDEMIVEYTFSNPSNRLENTGLGDTDPPTDDLNGILVPETGDNGIFFRRRRDTANYFAEFSGEGCIQLPTNGFINGGTSHQIEDRTIEFEFRWDGTTTTTPQILFEEGGIDKAGINMFLRGSIDAQGATELVMAAWETDEDGGPPWDSVVISTTGIQANKWYHAALVFIELGFFYDIEGYLDREEFGKSTIQVRFPFRRHLEGNCVGGMKQNTLAFDSSGDGYAAFTGDGLYFYGRIDNFRLFNTVQQPEPTEAPSTSPSQSPTASPTEPPTESPSEFPSSSPSASPTPPPRPCEGDSATLISDTASFVAAIDEASEDAASPTIVCVDVNAVLDFDSPAAPTVPSIGIDLTNKYLDAYCVGASETNWCTLYRSAGNGRFFFGSEPLGASFAGFRFENARRLRGLQDIDQTVDENGVSGGAFLFLDTGTETNGVTSEVAFSNCAFVNNTSDGDGGAIAVVARDSSVWNLIAFSCIFRLNRAYFYGGGISVAAKDPALVALNITESAFSGNVAHSKREADDVDAADNVEFTCLSTDADAVLVSDTNNNPTGDSCMEPSAAPSSSPSAPTHMPSLYPTQPDPMACEGVTIVTDTAGFIQAVEGASATPASPSTICVDVVAELVLSQELDITGKYFDAYCVGYSVANKCTLDRSGSVGRFFSSETPLGVSFTGFRFQNGSTESRNAGGAFRFLPVGRNTGEVAFADCDFINNTASYRGGAIEVQATSRQEWKISADGCTFQSNTADAFFGGGMYATAPDGGQVALAIARCVFSDNSAPFGGGDIYTSGDLVDLQCTDTFAVEVKDSAHGESDSICTPP